MGKHKTIPPNILEPVLEQAWEQLNKDIFDSQIKQKPTSLVWHSDITKTGGFCQYIDNKTGEVRIAIKDSLQSNERGWYLTLAHEMIHQLLWEIYCSVPEINKYTPNSFLADRSASFMLELHRISTKLGCTYQELQYWRSEDEDLSLRTKSQREYYKSKERAEAGRLAKEALFG